MSSALLDPEVSQIDYTYARINQISSAEEYIHLSPATPYKFYDYNKMVRKVQHKSVNNKIPLSKGALFQTVIFLDSSMRVHTRKTYTLLNMIGELGGITKVIMFVFGFFLYPISEHSFTLKALRKLYLAKSKEPILMKSRKNDQGSGNLKIIDTDE
jgi:hypothetical protein